MCSLMAKLEFCQHVGNGEPPEKAAEMAGIPVDSVVDLLANPGVQRVLEIKRNGLYQKGFDQ